MGGSRSTPPAAGSSLNLNAPATKYATTSSKAATWSRPELRGRQRAGSLAGTEDRPADRSRAAAPLGGGERRSEQRRLVFPAQALDQPRCIRERRPVDPLVGALRAARWHHHVAALASHVKPRTEQSCAVAYLRVRRMTEENVHPTAASAYPRRLGRRAVRTLQPREALWPSVVEVHVQDQETALLAGRN